MAETQTWTMRDSGDRYLLDLECKSEGLIDLSIAKYDYRGLFVRMPWRVGMEGGVVNRNRPRDDRAAAQQKKVADLRVGLHAWRQEVGAQMPTPNPSHDPSKPEFTPPPGKKKGTRGD